MSEEKLIAIHVVPKSSKNAIEGIVKDANGKEWLKVKLTVVPEDGKANKALIKLLSKEWKIPQSHLEIVSGHTSKYKIIKSYPNTKA